jgi:hypothetical protein
MSPGPTTTPFASRAVIPDVNINEPEILTPSEKGIVASQGLLQVMNVRGTYFRFHVFAKNDVELAQG